jgi:zinc D-Ala-D-Ala carboxypeptidase
MNQPCRGRKPGRLARLWAELGIPADYPLARGMPRQRETARLVPVGPNCRLAPRAARAWRALQAAARADAVTLVALSGFRSIRRQAEVIRRKLAQGATVETILRSIAAPGCSEHHTGCALDVGDDSSPPLAASFARTKAFRWLTRNAWRFGFRLSYGRRNPHGIVFEPWHWRWRA